MSTILSIIVNGQYVNETYSVNTSISKRCMLEYHQQVGGEWF